MGSTIVTLVPIKSIAFKGVCNFNVARLANVFKSKENKFDCFQEPERCGIYFLH